jgi:hypothetical protein
LVNQPVADISTRQTAVRRLAQMRQTARRFQATSFKMGSPHELRLLPQPLYRYQAAERPILDGALFAFVEGNDAEALLLLEVSTGSRQEPVWHYTLARMTSYRVVVRLDDRQILDAAPYWSNPRSANDPYVEATDGPFTLETAAPAGTAARSGKESR